MLRTKEKMAEQEGGRPDSVSRKKTQNFMMGCHGTLSTFSHHCFIPSSIWQKGMPSTSLILCDMPNEVLEQIPLRSAYSPKTLFLLRQIADEAIIWPSLKLWKRQQIARMIPIAMNGLLQTVPLHPVGVLLINEVCPNAVTRERTEWIRCSSSHVPQI